MNNSSMISFLNTIEELGFQKSSYDQWDKDITYNQWVGQEDLKLNESDTGVLQKFNGYIKRYFIMDDKIRTWAIKAR